MKHIRSLIVGIAILAAIAASSASAQPLQGHWVYICWFWNVPITNSRTCHALGLPMRWYWSLR